jgi:hypothetical protein
MLGIVQTPTDAKTPDDAEFIKFTLIGFFNTVIFLLLVFKDF